MKNYINLPEARNISFPTNCPQNIPSPIIHTFLNRTGSNLIPPSCITVPTQFLFQQNLFRPSLSLYHCILFERIAFCRLLYTKL